MSKRPYSEISSLGMCLTNQSTTTTTSITDLPVDVICLVIKRLPLSEVLRNQSLVCKLFYDAHLQHCRSSVKQLTLFGHYMLKEDFAGLVEPQNEMLRKQTLFEYARNTISISSLATINPSSCHLKLVVGLEEFAYAAIGTKFQSVTSLELYQPALERHYKPITAMINAWGEGDGGDEKKMGKKKKKVKAGGGDGQISATANQLTELKIFHSKEMYRLDGTQIKRGNSSCCLAYLLAGALTPDKAPALRRLVIVPGNIWVACRYRGNHNSYRGPLLAKINLSQVTTIDAPHCAVIDLPEEHWGTDHGCPIERPRPRELTIKTTLMLGGGDIGGIPWFAHSAGRRSQQPQVYFQPFLFRCLTGLTVSFGFEESEFLESMPPGLAVNLRRLSLQDVQWPLTKLVQQLVVPLTITTAIASKGEKGATTINDRLEELRVAWEYHHQNSPVEALASVVRFPALTTLHLVKSTLLHRADEMSALSALFPNLAHLRLDENHREVNLHFIMIGHHLHATHCPQCVQHVSDAFQELNRSSTETETKGGKGSLEEFLDYTAKAQLLPSSTAPACKAALVRRTVAAWPKLASITLQIDDFLIVADREETYNDGTIAVRRMEYLYRCESLRLRDPLTGEPLQEEDLKWTVEEVLY